MGPCPKTKQNRKKAAWMQEKGGCCSISERIATAMQISPLAWQSKGTLQSFLSRSLALGITAPKIQFEEHVSLWFLLWVGFLFLSLLQTGILFVSDTRCDQGSWCGRSLQVD